jgi:hypothetical protein
MEAEHMNDDSVPIKDILWRIASNLATLAATVQVLEDFAKKEGLASKELVELHAQARTELEVVFDPLFEAIERLKPSGLDILP